MNWVIFISCVLFSFDIQVSGDNRWSKGDIIEKFVNILLNLI